MKKSLSLVLAFATLLSISTTALAAEPVENNNSEVQYIDYDLEELLGDNGITPLAASAYKDASAGTVSANLMNGATGNVIGESSTFKFSGIPSGAKIKNIQAWNPSKSNVTQSKFTGVEKIQVVRNNSASDWFKYWITPEPSSMYPCNTSSFNGLDANATYSIRIQGRVITNQSGFDGFTARGTKVRVTYTV